MEHNWNKYFDTTSEYWQKIQKIYEENDHFPKIIVSGRNLHHKFMRAFSRLEGTEIDNDKDNLVSLSEGDHFLVHYYLWKCTLKGYRRQTANPVRLMFRKSFSFLTEETIKHIAEDWKIISTPNKGKKFSEQTKKKMSEAAKKRKSNSLGKHYNVGINHPMKGKHWRLENGKRVYI